MAFIIRRTCFKARDLVRPKGRQCERYVFTVLLRTFSDDKTNHPDFSSSTILVENGFNVQELPVIIRKWKDTTDPIDVPLAEPAATDSVDYNLIQAEFNQCSDLRDVFTLLSKCTKVTPNIALGAMERIYDIEKEPHALLDIKGNNIHLAKGAILDKLLKVIMKTEDTQTILNVLKSSSSFVETYKHKFCDELLFRTIDNKMNVDQICSFTNFLIDNKSIAKYAETIDKLWVGFVEKECDINETNIAMVFKILPGLKVSKRIVLSLLEQKLSDLWGKINVNVMQEILTSFVDEKYLSLQSFAIVGRWLYTNIHALDEDSLLDVVSKFTRLKYTDDQIEKAIEKYMKLKGNRIESQILIVGILNYCMQFQIRNKHILNSCSEYFVKYAANIPPSFFKSYVYPFGYLHFDPKNSSKFWKVAEKELLEYSNKINVEDLSSIILSHIFLGKYPLELVKKLFGLGNLMQVNNQDALKNLHLIDTAMSLECPNYNGPLIPKDQWSQPVAQDGRIKNIVGKIYKSLEAVAGSSDKLSIEVMVPHFSDKIYLIDVMFHAAGLGGGTYNWSKSLKNENIAILIHLPDHYCSDNKHLIGPQVMRRKHLRTLGFKVVSVKYSIISQFYTSFNTKGLNQYLVDNINNAEECL